jgi:general secretion pathway protein D
MRRILFSFVVMALMSVFILFPSGESCAEEKEDQKVTFNFVDVELSSVTKFISDITGKNFIFDERVKGKITIIAPSKLNIEDAFALYTSILELKGYTVVPSGINAYKIIPAAEARQKGIEITTVDTPVDESYIARLITLKDISSGEAFRLIQPVVSRNGYVSEFGPGNMLLVIDSGLNVQKILDIIDAVDKPTAREQQDIVFLKHSSADAVAKILNEGISRMKTAVARGKIVQGGQARAVADQRLNAIILFGDKSERESMKSLIAALDVPSPEAQGRINVFFLENADAEDLSKVLEGIIKGVQPKRKAAQGTAPVMPFEAAGGISITADKATNSLIVVASPADYQNLVRVIRQLDKRRRQVFVEAMIVEVSIDKLRELGTRWRVIARSEGEPVGIGGFGTLDPSAIQSLIYGLTGLSGGGMGNFLDIPFTSIDPSTGDISQSTLSVPGFAVLFNLEEFKGIVNVLSTPQILTSDNKEAEILVGENVPFVSSSERDITTTNTVLSSVERTDVGIILRITPQITEGDYVKLDIFQEISAVKEEPNADILINVGPTTTKRSTSTSVVVRDQQTVVIGGLMEEREEESITKVPVLGNIPILGWLFKTRSTTRKKTNLLVFITPHIIKNSDDLEKITGDKEKGFAKLEQRYTEGELLVKFKKDISAERARQIIDSEGASVIRLFKEIGVYHIQLGKGQDVEEAVKRFSAFPEVEYAEPNFTIRMQNQKGDLGRGLK